MKKTEITIIGLIIYCMMFMFLGIGIGIGM